MLISQSLKIDRILLTQKTTGQLSIDQVARLAPVVLVQQTVVVLTRVGDFQDSLITNQCEERIELLDRDGVD